MKEITFTNI